jgi:hypothetical protein
LALKLPTTAAAVSALKKRVTAEIAADKNMTEDVFDIEHLPKPNATATASDGGVALTPEVMSPRRKPPLTSTRPAEEMLRQAAPKAVSTLIACLDSDQAWIRITAARAIVERVIPAVVDDDPEIRGVLVFPPGTNIAVAVLPEQQEALATLRRQVE